MKPTIFFLHSAGPQGEHEGSADFVQWLIARLGASYTILHPIMPHPENPDYEPWKAQLRQELASLQGDVIFIGHSFGGSVLLKYLTEEKIPATITGMFLCATPFWGADDDWQYEPFALPDNFAALLPSIPSFGIFHSTQDPHVPFSHAEHYKQALPDATLHAIVGDSHAFEQGLPELAAAIEQLH